jgi:hypothetical protein
MLARWRNLLINYGTRPGKKRLFARDAAEPAPPYYHTPPVDRHAPSLAGEMLDKPQCHESEGNSDRDKGQHA